MYAIAFRMGKYVMSLCQSWFGVDRSNRRGGGFGFRRTFRLHVRQPRVLQVLAHRLRTGFQAEPASQDLRDPLRPVLRLGLLQFGDLRLDRGR